MDAGLENVVAAQTVLSLVDGANGRLIIRGFAVETLAATAEFEDVLALLWDGLVEDLPDRAELGKRLGQARVEAFQLMTPLLPVMATQSPMEAIRLAVSALPDGDDLECALLNVAMLAVATSAAARQLKGAEVIAPNASLGHAADLLCMMGTNADDPALIRGMNAYLVTVCEHGLNASTFTARCVASTQAGLTSAVAGGISALKGPLHGGAPGPVLDMLDAIGDVSNAEDWIRAALDRGERLMGFGHRIYRVRDPRADALKLAAAQLPQSAGRLDMAQRIESEILTNLKREKPDRSLDTNVEYYTAILLEALGVPREAFTCVFACSRSAGWIAHAREQLATRRIVRPRGQYVGPMPEIAA